MYRKTEIHNKLGHSSPVIPLISSIVAFSLFACSPSQGTGEKWSCECIHEGTGQSFRATGCGADGTDACQHACGDAGGTVAFNFPGAIVDTGTACGSSAVTRSLTAAPPDSTKVVVDPTASTGQVTSGTQGSGTVAASGVVYTVPGPCIPDPETETCTPTIQIDQLSLGFGTFSVGSTSVTNGVVNNDGFWIGAIDEVGNFSIPVANASVTGFGFVNGQRGAQTFLPDAPLSGSFVGGRLRLSGSGHSGGISVFVNVSGTAQPAGLDTDADGVPDFRDNCPLIANPTQARVAAPSIVAPPDALVSSCSNLSLLGQPTVRDLCGATPITITNNAPAVLPLGTTTVKWTAIDANGNVATATQIVTVVLGDDPTCCPAGTHIIMGTSSNDTLTGTSGSDCILGLGAQDHINGNGGDDYISGGDGDDTIDGGAGNDHIWGGSGQDQISGGIGNDIIDGGDGDDTVHAGDGDDVVHGGAGQDHLFGENGNDQLFGDAGDDTLDGGPGNDLLNGGGLHDTCIGGAGVNTFVMCQTRQ